MIKKIITILTAALLFLLPWQTRLIILPGIINGGYSEYGTVSLYGTEILLWFIVILLIVDFFVSRRVLAANGRRERIKMLVILGALYLYSLFFHQNLVTLNYLRIFIEGFILFLIIGAIADKAKFYWAFTPTPKKINDGDYEHSRLSQAADIKNDDNNLLVWGFIAGAALQAVLGIYQFFSGFAFSSKWLGMAAHDPGVLGTYVVEAGFGRWLRAYGALPHPNILAGYLMVAILIFIKIRLDNQSTGFKPEAAVLPVLFTGFFLTFSRSAWIALAMGIVILLAPKLRTLKSKSLIIGLWTSAVSVVCLSVLLWPLISTRTLADNRLEIKSSSERISYYNEAWMVIKKNPWFGVGLGNYTRVVRDIIDSSRSAYSYQPVHNVFVLAFAEMGIAGICLMAAAIYLLRKKIYWKNIIYLLPLFIIGLFDHYLWTLYSGIILVFVYASLVFDKKLLTRSADLS